MNPWRIYYDNETTRDHTEGLPETEVQKLGVQVIVQQRSSDGRFFVIRGAEYYVYITSGEWISIGLNGLQDYCMNCLDQMVCVTAGRAISKIFLAKIAKRAQADADKALSLD